MKDHSISPKAYRRYLLLLFIAAFIPRFILIYLNHTPLRTPMDEFCTMSTAAHVAGLDWEQVTKSSHHYYGGGFTILLAPLFRFISNPFALYAAVMCVAAALQSLIAPIAFHLMYRYFHVRDKRFLLIGAFTSTFMVATCATLFYNEHIVILLFWVIIWIFCILLDCQDNPGKKAKWSILLILTVCYCITIHARTKIYFIVILLTVLIYYLVYRKWLVARIPSIVSAAAGYFLARQFIQWVKASVWLYEEGELLKNTDVAMNLSLELLLSPISWQGWLSTIIGQIHTSLTFTVGFAAIAIPLMVVLLYRALTSSPVFSKKTWAQGKNALVTMERPYLPVISLFCILSIGGTIFAQSLTWLFRVKGALEKNPYGSSAYGYKALTYFRYYGVYIGPFFLAALVLLYHNRNLVKKYWGYILTFFVGLQALFACFVLPHIYGNATASEVYWAFGLAKAGDKMHTWVYVMGILAACIGFLIMFFCYLKKKILPPLILLCLLLVYQYGYCSIFRDGGRMDSYNTRADST